ncbi:MAG: ABC transporter permease, partial [Acidimicrobiales bacterium]
MIRLGLRLSLHGGREAALRVLVTAAAVALGVALLLCALAGVNGLRSQSSRGAWLNSSPVHLACSPSCGSHQRASTSGASTSDPLWWLLSVEQFNNQAIDRVDIAATGPRAPVPPGIPRLPGPGQYYASPALTTLLRSVPTNELSDRFPGREVGTIGQAALPSPSSLVIVIGYEPRQLSQLPGAGEIQHIQRTLASCYACQSGDGSGPILQWILAGGAVALLLPVLILIATATRLSAARREQRFAAMRLVGATPRQVGL